MKPIAYYAVFIDSLISEKKTPSSWLGACDTRKQLSPHFGGFFLPRSIIHNIQNILLSSSEIFRIL